MLVLAIVAGLFAWSIGGGKSPEDPLYVSILPGSLAAIAFVITLVLYFVVKRNFYQSLLINYILLTATGWLLEKVVGEKIDQPENCIGIPFQYLPIS